MTYSSSDSRGSRLSTCDCLESSETALIDSPRRLDSLSALRFFLIIVIAFNHATLFIPAYREMTACPFNLSACVGFFFILSGFALTYSASGSRSKPAIIQFYIARLARIWPAHVLALLLLVFIAPAAFGVNRHNVAIFISNLFLIHSWIPRGDFCFSFNAPSWSISCLMFLYLCFPFWLPVVVKRTWLSLMIAGGFSLGLIFLSSQTPLPELSLNGPCLKSLLYGHPLSRFFEFTCGMSAAIAFRRYFCHRRFSMAAMTLLEVGMFFAVAFINLNSSDWRSALEPICHKSGALWLYYSGFTCIPFSILLCVIATEKGLISQIIRLPLFVLLGKFSFGIYLLHAVLLVLPAVYCQQQQYLARWLFFSYPVALLLCAALFHVCWEIPSRRAVLRMSQWIFSGHTFMHSSGRKNLISSLCTCLVCLVLVHAPPASAQEISETKKAQTSKNSNSEADERTVKPTAKFDEILDLSERSSGSLLMRAEAALRSHRIDAAIALARKGLKRNPDEIALARVLAEALDTKLDAQGDSADPSIYNECVRYWLYVLRNEGGMEKGLTFRGIGMPFAESLYKDEENVMMARQRLTALTGRTPKFWETNERYLKNVLRPVPSVSGKIVK